MRQASFKGRFTHSCATSSSSVTNKQCHVTQHAPAARCRQSSTYYTYTVTVAPAEDDETTPVQNLSGANGAQRRMRLHRRDDLAVKGSASSSLKLSQNELKHWKFSICCSELSTFPFNYCRNFSASGDFVLEPLYRPAHCSSATGHCWETQTFLCPTQASTDSMVPISHQPTLRSILHWIRKKRRENAHKPYTNWTSCLY